nr:WecB/TagA/CpsF family glycosyltransferase [uncultured Lentibacter sp.]
MIFKANGCEITVNMADKAALFAALRERFARGQGFALATLNLDHLVKMSRLQSFAQAYAAQDFVVADGNPVVWLSRLARRPVSLLPGSELVLPLAQLAAAQQVPVALFGASERSLARAAEVLCAKVPGLQIVCQIAPPMGFDPASPAAVTQLDALADSGAGLVFLALGAPKQEVFAAIGRSRTPKLGFVSVGAGLDFLSGAQQRAPGWVRWLALEWAWRAAAAPLRLGPRYARCLVILPRLLREALALR